MLYLKKIIFSVILLSTGIASSAYALENTYMYANVVNATHYQMRITPNGAWQRVWGEAGLTNNNPIAVGQNLQTVAINHFSNSTKYQGTYDIWKKSGDYLGNCTFSITGYPNDFTHAYAEFACNGNIMVSVTKDPTERPFFGLDNGTFTFIVSTQE